MKITAQEEYGLRCLLRLAAARDGHALTIPEVAAAEGMSGPYVAKLLSVLRQAGLIESARGRAGGYRLARPASEIGLGAVLGALGEPLYDDPGYCERHKGSETEESCVHLSGCALRGLWQTLGYWMGQVLDQVTLADLLSNGTGIQELIRSRMASNFVEPPAALRSLTLVKDD
jgi:Rrf2 family protein